VCDPRSLEMKPLLGLNSGYVRRAEPNLPKQGGKKPWLIRQNYILDMLTMRLGRISDGTLQFSSSHSMPSNDIPSAVEAVASAHD
jgi:monooxygenase